MKAILVLDDNSKERIKSNISVLISKGIFLVNNLNEITDSMLSETKTTFILDGVFQEADGVASLRFSKAALHLDYIFLMQKSRWNSVIKTLGKLYQTEIVNLNYDILLAASYDDKSLETVSSTAPDYDAIKLARKICSEDTEYESNEKILANTLLSVLAREKQTIDRCDIAELQCEQLECENAILRKKNDAYLHEYTTMFSKATQLNAVLNQYEVIFTKDIYTKVDLYSHSERPAIIYIKEYEWLNGFDQLITTLFNTIRVQNKQSCKVLRLFDSSSSRRLLTLPKYYKIIKNRYKMTDVETNDFVCKTGDYVRILDALLLNRMHLDVLIIVDCKDHNDTVLSGTHLIFNACGRKSSLDSLRLSAENTITNDADSKLHWEEYDTSTLGKHEAFISLSSKPVIGIILQSLHQFEGV